QLRDYNKSLYILKELRSDAMKMRHWNYLTKRLNVHLNIQELSLGDVWNLNLIANEKIFKDVLQTAQGEYVLELAILKIKDFWSMKEFELVNYQNKCRLIKGYEDIFDSINDHLKDLSAMKTSQYYKIFEEEATSWEKKLDKLHVICDLLINVQRTWVYLEGVFAFSDIKHMLPSESRKFGVV